MSAPRRRHPLNARDLVPADIKLASNEITSELRYIHDNYIIQFLREHAVHNIYNYTFHGDVMINSLLRARDRLGTYFLNIPDPSDVELGVIDEENIYKEGEITEDTPPIMFLPLYEMKPELALFYGLYNILPYKEYDEYHSRDELLYALPNSKKLDMFNRFKEPYYKFLDLIHTRQLGVIRAHIYNIARNIHLTLCNAPQYSPPLHTNAYYLYRVVKKFYLSTDPETVTTVCSFVSSTISSTKANQLKEDGRFGKKIYVFQVHPLCVGMCIDLISYFEREDEFLLGFGCKFLFRRELHKNAQLFTVIPQTDPAELLPPTYDEYISKYYTGPRLSEPNSMPALESASSQNGGVLKLTLRARGRSSRRIPISKRTIRMNMKAKSGTKRRTVRSLRATNAGDEQRRGNTVRSLRAQQQRQQQQQRQVKPLNLNSSKYKKSRLYDRDGDLRDGILEVRPITEEEKALVAQMGAYH